MSDLEKKQTNAKDKASKPTKASAVDSNDPKVLLARSVLVVPFLLFSAYTLTHNQQQVGYVSFGVASFIAAPGFLGNQLKTMAQGALREWLNAEHQSPQKQRALPPGENPEED